ncbi:unnamed protein product [Rotaria socialis]|uniref:ACB domain-containing protein n=1 Tax=Rotaria socialis TaxID=392032 RepID=A0A818CMN9_9BILA|nr:unnamed protein product [Rotaria socialis]CAF3531223.1 unnamed protein product [Rotaria socialis]CAF3751732.1 unnamed protein product [Rotaria socialis]CAF4413048.1 unnamed protein product [Rotaria socialis]CAF4706783.1 unnamed protein product [Rotaria socialis]
MSQARFDQAAADVKNLSKKPSDDELLQLYGLFKQATIGDNNTTRPGMLDLKGKAKWDAWDKNKGKGKEVAQQEYVAFVQTLQAK